MATLTHPRYELPPDVLARLEAAIDEWNANYGEPTDTHVGAAVDTYL